MRVGKVKVRIVKSVAIANVIGDLSPLELVSKN
jgi:hypothetical protein